MTKSRLEFECVRALDEFSAKKALWNEFINKNFPTAYYLDHDWLSEWWKCYAAGEKVYIFFVYLSGSLLGFLPLVVRRGTLSGFPVRKLGFLGSGFGPENFPILSHKEAILTQLFTELDLNVCWDILDFKRLNSEILEVFKRSFSQRRVQYEEIDMKNPIIELKGKYEDYFSSRSRNFRANYRKKTKRINSWGSMQIAHEDSNDVALILGKIEEIGKESWQGEKGVGLSSIDQGRAFLKEFVDIFSKRGTLNISFIYLDNKPIAYLLGARIDKTYFAIETAYKQKYFDVSPGMLLHLSVLERLYKEGGVDMMDLGYDASYKRRWTELNRPEKQILCYNNKIYLRLLFLFRQSTLYSKILAFKNA